MPPLKILQLCKKFPYPLKDGEAIAVTNMSKAMAELDCEITLLSLNTSKHYTDVDRLPQSFNHYKEVHTVQLNNDLSGWDAFKNLFSKDSFHVSRFYSDQFESKLIEILDQQEFDIVQLETLYLAPYINMIRAHSKALVVMRAHNIEHEIWQRLQTNVRFLPKKWYIQYLTGKLKRFEVETLNSYDFLVPISDVDLGKFRKLGYINGAKAIPIGLDLPNYQAKPINTAHPLCLSFIGSLDWMPNLEGLEWFIERIWPKLHSEFNDMQLHIAGRNAPKRLLNASLSNVVVHGEVECAKDFLNKHQIMIVPLLSGSGMRAKIIEAMALGRIVVTTSLGLEGIPAQDRKEVFIADTPEEYQKVIRYLHDYISELDTISEAAKVFVQCHYSHKQLAVNFHNALIDYKRTKTVSEPFVN